MSDSAKQLQSYIERIERLEEEKRALQGDIREIYAEAKANGFDPKIMRKVVAERRRSAADVEEEQALIDTYKVSLGMLRDTPLGDAALRAAKKDHGRAAPRAAGKADGVSPSLAPDAPPTRPDKDPASPDPAPPLDTAIHSQFVSAGFVHLGGNEYEAPAEPDYPEPSPRLKRAAKKFFDTLGTGDSVSISTPESPGVKFTNEADGSISKSEPPDIPPFLDRRAKGEEAPA